MTIKAVNAYRVQSENDPDEWYEVVIEPEKTPGSRCNCEDYVLRDKVCEHIDRALLCYLYGI